MTVAQSPQRKQTTKADFSSGVIRSEWRVDRLAEKDKTGNRDLPQTPALFSDTWTDHLCRVATFCIDWLVVRVGTISC